MVGTTLVEIREHVEALASDDGDYYLACARTGERPVPAVGMRFDGRAAARSAAQATEHYRAALRRYDPRLPCYDVIAREDVDPRSATHRATHRDGDGPPTRGSNAAERESATDRRSLVEFCHRVAAAVFETLSDAGHDAVESAVMDAYFDLAETVGDPDDLCLRLLESVAAELGAHLDPAVQADVVADAAALLTPAEPTDEPVTATLADLRRLGLVGEYARSPASVDLAAGTRTVVVDMSGYALSPRNGRLPVLPLVLDVRRRRPDWQPSVLRVVDVDDGWRVEFVLARDGDPDGLATVPIRSEV